MIRTQVKVNPNDNLRRVNQGFVAVRPASLKMKVKGKTKQVVGRSSAIIPTSRATRRRY